MKLNDVYQLFPMNVKEFFVRKMLQMVILQEIFHKSPKIKKIKFHLSNLSFFLLFLIFDQENNNVDQNFHQ